MRTHLRLLVVLALLLLPGCVELDGQRITFRYLAEKDELQVLLFYDGIHDRDSDDHEQARKQLIEFVRDGDILLLDWPAHFEMGRIREGLQDPEKYTPAERRIARAMGSSVRTTILGHYRDVDGRIGAAQLVVVSKAGELLSAVNASISEQIVSGDVDKIWKRTAARMLEGAKKGEQWLRFDGHSIVMSAPVHLPEWQRNKGELMADLLKDVRRKDDDEFNATPLVQLLATSPVSLIETADRVTVRIGTKETPTTFRYRLRETDKTGLDEAVLAAVPSSFDERLSTALLADDDAEVDPAVQAVLEWGPPEERVRALLAVARGEDADRAKVAARKLSEFAERWNREVGFPEAPTHGVVRFKRWYREMIRFPAE